MTHRVDPAVTTRPALLRRLVLLASAGMVSQRAFGQGQITVVQEPGPTPVSNLTTADQQAELERVMTEVLGNGPRRYGRVRIGVPQLADNGNSVACSLQIDSPMTETDFVRAVHLFLPRNPRPLAFSAILGPWNPVARVDTRVRLSGSQRILAAAIMNNGSVWIGMADAVVTLSACLEGS